MRKTSGCIAGSTHTSLQRYEEVRLAGSRPSCRFTMASAAVGYYATSALWEVSVIINDDGTPRGVVEDNKVIIIVRG
jgi:hypothetical protein